MLWLSCQLWDLLPRHQCPFLTCVLHCRCVPPSGFTLQQVYTEPKVSPEHTWCKADHRQFNVRVGPDYNRHKKKAPSAAPLYEPFAVDVFWYVSTTVF